MERLKIVDPETAEGKPREMMEGVKHKLGMVPNIMRIMANSPAGFGAYLGMSTALAGGSFSPVLREQIAILVGKLNGCDYCVAAHSFIGKNAGLSDEQVQNALNAKGSDARTDAVLNFVKVMVEKRAEVTDEEVAALKNAGVSDAEVVELIAVVCLNIFTNYFNHVANTPVDFPPKG